VSGLFHSRATFREVRPKLSSELTGATFGAFQPVLKALALLGQLAALGCKLIVCEKVPQPEGEQCVLLPGGVRNGLLQRR
jgi:hypothetical protein